MPRPPRGYSGTGCRGGADHHGSYPGGTKGTSTVVVAQMPRLTDDSWRTAGCSERCRPLWITAAGRHYPEQMAVHDPSSHEAYGTNVLARDFALLSGRVVRTGELVIDGPLATVAVNGERVMVTPVQREMLFYLASNIGRLCTLVEILRAVWGQDYVPLEGRRYSGPRVPPETHMLRVHMSRLRGVLGPARRLVVTEKALGYRLLDEPPVEDAP